MSMQITATNEVLHFVKKYVKKLGINDYTLEIKPVLTRGDNYLGYVTKLQIKNKCNDVLHNWIIKSAPHNILIRLSTPIDAMYNREIFMYTEVFPLFKQFQDDYNIVPLFNSFPKYFTSSEEPPHECIIMEDMNILGYKLHSRQKPLNVDHVRLVMKQYGHLHALSFALRDKNPLVFKKLSKKLYDVNIDYEDNSHTISKEINMCKKALASLNPDTDKVVFEKLQNCLLNLKFQVKQLMKSEACGNHGVFNHGDCWNNNILFRYSNDDPSKPIELCFVDWQLSRYGSPVFDLSYFLFTCTNKETRKQFYESFIIDYYESLSSFLKKFECDPEKLFPFHVLQDHLKKFSLFGLYIAIQLLGIILKDPKDIPDDLLNLTSLEDALQKYMVLYEHGKEYEVAIRDLLLDFNDYGYYFC